jgi:MFS family permease
MSAAVAGAPCPDCGEVNPPASRFCTNCGFRLDADANVPSPRPDRPLGVKPAPATAGRGGMRLLWWYVPADSLLQSPSFRAMMTMRVATETAVNALSYGMLIQIVKNTTDPRLVGILAALVTISTVAPAAVFGPIGGVVVDRVPKRMMLLITNLTRALLCFAFLLLGTGTVAIYGLLVALTIVTQFATPAEAAIVPRVVPRDHLAAANSFSNLSESAGAMIGTAILAPILVKLPGAPESLILVCGLLLSYAAIRAVAIRLTVPEVKEGAPTPDDIERKPWLAGTREALLEAWDWLAGDRAAFISMMLLVLASTANLVLVTLAPKFTAQALGVDPEFAVFVFGPAVLGVLTGLALTPRLAEVVNKRLLVTIGFLLMVAVLLLLGAINGVTAVLKNLGPIGALFRDGPLGYKDGRLGAALVLAAPLGFGLSMVQVSAHTLLHERVPLEMQGRVFALQGAVKNATAILPLLVLGGMASILGDVRPVMVIAALLILCLALYGGARSAEWTAGRGNPLGADPSPAGEPT